jgi:hypothetical protein
MSGLLISGHRVLLKACLDYDDQHYQPPCAQNQGRVPMIRAVVQNGLIRPLDPLPLDWDEGRLVVVEDAESTASDDLLEWYQELTRLGPAQVDPGEREKIQAVMADADAQAKELVRREMGSC